MWGGGNVAIDAARISSRCTDAKISMFCLEQRTGMPASEEEIREALEEGIQLHCGWGPREVAGRKWKSDSGGVQEVHPGSG